MGPSKNPREKNHCIQSIHIWRKDGRFGYKVSMFLKVESRGGNLKGTVQALAQITKRMEAAGCSARARSGAKHTVGIGHRPQRDGPSHSRTINS